MTAFSHSLRILTCAECGAPVEANLEGGQIRCSYCGVENHLAPRDESRDLAQAAQPLAMSEMERMARLRDQESSGSTLPASLRELVDVDGLLLEDRIDDAKRRWLAARAELVKAPSFASSERLFFLSLLVVPSCEPREARAVLETGVELLSDEGHRHILRCLLAREAVGGGDPDAAEAWLAACHPRPLELRMDSAYRLATAALATARSDHQGVLTILGEDTPLAADFALDCAVLRIHGLDAVGREERAVTELEELEGRMGADAVYRAIRTGVPMGLCFRVRRAALRRRKEWWLAETEKVIHPPELQGQSFLRRLGSALRFFLVFSAVFSAAASGLAIFLAAVAFEHSSNETIYRLLTVAVSAGPCLALALFVFAVVGRIRQRAAARERRAVLKREIEELTSREARDR